MAKSTPSTILLKGNPLHREADADAAITPGYLCELTATGVKKHATAGGNAQALFAREADQIGDGIDTDYAADDRVYLLDCNPGDEIYALVAAAASAISVNDPLESAGDGTLRKHTAQSINEAGSTIHTNYVDRIVAYAKEAKDNSAGSAEARIKIIVA